MLVIGLTGGIASGKSTAARLFAQRGVPIIDADQISRELVEAGSPCLEEIVSKLGIDVLDASGNLDRAKMRARIFVDGQAKRVLEEILHPAIRSQMQSRISQLSTPYCILVIPLLVETGQNDLVDRVLVIDTPEEAQHSRLRQRDRASDEMVRAILDSQASRSDRLRAADDVINNDGNLADLENQVETLHQRYLAMAAAGAP